MKIILYLFTFSFCSSISAQQSLPILEKNIATAYNKQTRNITGKPGLKYWQNKADYNINVNFNPATRLVKGSVNISYVNNSPDTLKELWFKLYPNLYKKGNAAKNIKPADQGDGVSITSMKINNASKTLGSLIIDSTNMHTSIAPLAPGANIKLDIEYYYTLNKGSHVRTGQIDSVSYFIAYFFPRIAVYDDIDGWNKYPYRGSEEFYNDFCNFKAAVTVPGNYVVWATGDLQNTKKVLNKKILKKN